MVPWFLPAVFTEPILLPIARHAKRSVRAVPDRATAARGSDLKEKKRRSSGGGQKFVAVDARGDAPFLLQRLDAHDFGEAADVHVARERDFTGQGKDKFDRGSGQVIRIA